MLLVGVYQTFRSKGSRYLCSTVTFYIDCRLLKSDPMVVNLVVLDADPKSAVTCHFVVIRLKVVWEWTETNI